MTLIVGRKNSAAVYAAGLSAAGIAGEKQKAGISCLLQLN